MFFFFRKHLLERREKASQPFSFFLSRFSTERKTMASSSGAEAMRAALLELVSASGAEGGVAGGAGGVAATSSSSSSSLEDGAKCLLAEAASRGDVGAARAWVEFGASSFRFVFLFSRCSRRNDDVCFSLNSMRSRCKRNETEKEKRAPKREKERRCIRSSKKKA